MSSLKQVVASICLALDLQIVPKIDGCHVKDNGIDRYMPTKRSESYRKQKLYEYMGKLIMFKFSDI